MEKYGGAGCDFQLLTQGVQNVKNDDGPKRREQGTMVSEGKFVSENKMK